MVDVDVADGPKRLRADLYEIRIGGETAVAHLHVADCIVGRTVLEADRVVLTLDVAILHECVPAFEIDAVATMVKETANRDFAHMHSVAPVKIERPAPSVAKRHILDAHVPAITEPHKPRLLENLQ